MREIAFHNSQQLLALDQDLLRERIVSVLELEGISAATISVALVTDAVIHQVNREHLDHDYPTDVISFLYGPELLGRDSAGEAEPLDGEVIVSVETAIRESARFGWQPVDELTLYLVHGVLHLCGYDDQSPADLAEMRAAECRVLQRWNLLPNYSDRGETDPAEVTPPLDEPAG